MKAETSIRQEQIIEAALRRFSHFGIAKTTITEIADDMAVSKQVLSYYFNDKQSLVHAVIDKLTTEYGNTLKMEIGRSNSVLEGLLKLTEVKGIFFEKYFMLAHQAEQMEIMYNGTIRKWKHFMSDKECGLLTILFENGIRSGELKQLDAGKTAELLLETLYAFSRCVKEKDVIPGAEAFKQLLLKQQEVIKIFYQGLKAQTWQS
jgi:TetR/AcrR family transcriptional regulator